MRRGIAVLKFQLFRIKVYPRTQQLLFEEERSRSEVLRETVASLPTAEFRSGLTWHVGNLTEIDANGVYFRLGRTSTATIEIFDSQRAAFIDQEFEAAPYTHVILDYDLEVCAIANKPRLSPTIKGIARRFARLLNNSPRARELGGTFEIDDIKDPNDFIIQLKEAYSVSKFSVRFSRPNPFDAQEHFVRPFQRMIEESDGEQGKAEIKGKDLNPNALEAVARSAAATGDDASAWLEPTEGARKIKKQLRGNTVTFSERDIADQDQRRSVLDRMRDLYHKIRGKRDENE
jgi:hypothetical protein